MPIPFSIPPPEVTVDVYWDSPHQQFANNHAERWHEESLRVMGEYTAWVLRWRVEDHTAGLVDRCSVCGVDDPDYFRVYGQPDNANCPNCLGTTFEGGYRAIVVRPTTWNFGEEDNQEGRRGEVSILSADVQTTSDFRAKRGDWALQHDGRRWQVQGIRDTKVHTGFIGTDRDRQTMGYGYTMQLEDPSSLIYSQTLNNGQLATMDVNNHFPTSFPELEDIAPNGYLLERP